MPSPVAAFLGVRSLFSSLFGLLFVASVALAQASPQPPEFGALATAPTPDWVTPKSWDTVAPDAHLGSPAVGLLLDAQTRLGPGPTERFHHSVTLLKNGEGVRRFAELSISINPEYEHVLIHSLRVHRTGLVEDRLPATEFKTLQREPNIENQLYDGTRTFYAVLSDVRPGDILEQSYTVVGDHPLVADRAGSAHYVGGMIPFAAQSFEVRQPAGHPELAAVWWTPPGTQGLPAAIYDSASVQARLVRADTPSQRIWRWSARDLPAVPMEQFISWRAAPLLPYLRLSAFHQWNDVAAWGRTLFAAPAALPDELEQLVTHWQNTLPDREARIAAAIRWVQDDIRYFAFAMGENNWRPRDLTTITSTRFGDCKDKSLLLAALLRRLGEYAWPALVNTYAREHTHTLAPSPHAFNHAIVALRDDTGWRWTDPTLRLQRGPGAAWRVPDYGLGLVLAPGPQTLLSITRPPVFEPDTILTDEIDFTPENHARIRHRLVLRGEAADLMRQRLDAEPLTEIGLRWAHFIGRFYEGLEETSDMRAADDHETGIITLHAEYLVRDALGAGDSPAPFFTSVGYGARMLFDPLDTARRRWPMETSGRRWIRHEIAVSTPFELQLQTMDEGLAAPDVRYTVTAGGGARRFRAVHDWKTLRDWVPASEVPAYGETIRQLLRLCGLSAIAKEDAPDPAPGPTP